jgi:hypothetical protein
MLLLFAAGELLVSEVDGSGFAADGNSSPRLSRPKRTAEAVEAATGSITAVLKAIVSRIGAASEDNSAVYSWNAESLQSLVTVAWHFLYSKKGNFKPNSQLWYGSQRALLKEVAGDEADSSLTYVKSLHLVTNVSNLAPQNRRIVQIHEVPIL